MFEKKMFVVCLEVDEIYDVSTKNEAIKQFTEELRMLIMNNELHRFIKTTKMSEQEYKELNED